MCLWTQSSALEHPARWSSLSLSSSTLTENSPQQEAGSPYLVLADFFNYKGGKRLHNTKWHQLANLVRDLSGQ